ncbi:OFA family MFS transporter [Lyngbya sp. CCY1209]|uniref:L-lactate MFS transporter n=1 Tax=Lyngbya sp. CCY1209 TaxID=2886103 RepID=UPI002D2083B6|nr:OFA family MFS transporter [Lyngbya sp. CCY1209]MEB3885350.1 OFA family MFS transporter [Lyngbya sp. CCY1209]
MNETTPFKLFGLPPSQGRWLFVPLGIAVMLCLGTVYSWSIFRKPLEQLFDLSATQSLLPFTILLVTFAVLMPIAGFYLRRFGVRRVVACGGVVMGIGYILSGFAPNLFVLILAYGIIAGAGVGIAYGVPLAVCASWFPDRKGLAVGLTVVGFGLSPLVTAPLATRLIAAYGVLPTFIILGVVFTVIVAAIATQLKLAPEGWNPSQPNVKKPEFTTAISETPMLRSPSFYGLWLCYTIGTFVGLSAIGIGAPVGQEIIKLDAGTAAIAVSIFAIFNGVGRPLFGWLTDRLKPKGAAMVSYVAILIGSILMLNASEGQVLTYMVAFALFWMSLGGWLAIAPTATLTFFKPENYAQNYGIVFTAYGVGALLGTLVAGRIRDIFGSYTYAFYPMAGLAIVGIILAQFMLRPTRSKVTETASPSENG